MKRFLPILIALILIVAVTGCGGSSKNEKYAAELNEEVTDGFGKSVEVLATDPSKDNVKRATANLRRLATNIQGIDAPNDEIAADAQRLADSLRGFAKTIDTYESDPSMTKQSLTARAKLASQSISSGLNNLNEDLK